MLEQARIAGCKILPLESVIKKRSLRYWGHITRMNKKQLHRMIAGACRKKPPNGKLHLGDVLDDSLFAFDIDVRDWEKHAQKIPATATRPEYSPWGGIVDDGMHRFTARWVNKLVRAWCLASAVELAGVLTPELPVQLSRWQVDEPHSVRCRKLEQLMVDAGHIDATALSPPSPPHRLSTFYSSFISPTRAGNPSVYYACSGGGAGSARAPPPSAPPPSTELPEELSLRGLAQLCVDEVDEASEFIEDELLAFELDESFIRDLDDFCARTALENGRLPAASPPVTMPTVVPLFPWVGLDGELCDQCWRECDLIIPPLGEASCCYRIHSGGKQTCFQLGEQSNRDSSRRCLRSSRNAVETPKRWTFAEKKKARAQRRRERQLTADSKSNPDPGCTSAGGDDPSSSSDSPLPDSSALSSPRLLRDGRCLRVATTNAVLSSAVTQHSDAGHGPEVRFQDIIKTCRRCAM